MVFTPIQPKPSPSKGESSESLEKIVIRRIPCPYRVASMDKDKEERVQIKMSKVPYELKKDCSLSFPTSATKSKVNDKTKVWMRKYLNNAGHTLSQLRDLLASTKNAYDAYPLESEGVADLAETSASRVIIGCMCQSIIATLRSNIREMETVDIVIRQAGINQSTLSEGDAQTVSHLLQNHVIPLLTPLWEDSILYPQFGQSTSGGPRNKILQEVMRWRVAWDVHPDHDHGSLQRLAKYIGGRSTSTLEDFAHLRDLAEQLLLKTETILTSSVP